eukprot:gene28241-34103_t
MLLANKMAVDYLPSPAAVSFIQLVFATVVVLVIKASGHPVDTLDYDRLKAYAPYIAVFLLSIYANMKALSCSNVETVIVFRACTPIAVSAIEYLFMERQFPTPRSMLAMGILAIGATLYCYTESQISLIGMESYLWTSIYFILITISMTYGKALTDQVHMQSVWGPVLYSNALSLVPMFFLGSMENGFLEHLYSVTNLPLSGMCVMLFSCIVGTAIGYTGWECRCLVSATTYTLVGVVNKFLTVLLNVLLWDKHSSPIGLIAVCVCLAAGTIYEQAPRVSKQHLNSKIELRPLNSPGNDEEE